MKKREVKPYSVWRHFKGFTAVVITIATHSETGEKMVIYNCKANKEIKENTNHEDGIYARPMEMFLSEVDHKKYPDIKQKYRFEEIKD